MKAVSAWWVAIVGGALVLGGLMLLFRVPPPPAAAPSREALTPVGLARLGAQSRDDELKEEAMMRDPTPLFLPTRFNATDDALTARARREPGDSFQGYPPILAFAESQLKLALPAAVTVPAAPAEAFALDLPSRPFVGFGQVSAVVTPVSARAAFVTVVSAGDGTPMIAEPLKGASPPVDAPWQPLEFLVAVNASGVVGPPVLTESSRVVSVDRYFQDHLLDALKIGERLAPGFYRVGIGP